MVGLLLKLAFSLRSAVDENVDVHQKCTGAINRVHTFKSDVHHQIFATCVRRCVESIISLAKPRTMMSEKIRTLLAEMNALEEELATSLREKQSKMCFQIASGWNSNARCAPNTASSRAACFISW
jgi:hypothetical protein